MANGNLSACLAVTLPHEGGYTNDKRDPGNWTGGKVGVGKLKGTKYGVAANTYPDLDIKNLTLDDVLPIYRRNYWQPVRGEALPFGVDLATFDFGVNSGPARAIRNLQAVIGAKADGEIGADTILKASKADGKKTIQALCARRLSFLRSLKIWKTFGKGWSRRVADVEAKAVAMWLARGKPLTTEHAKELAREAGKAAGKANRQTTQAGGSVVGGGGVATGTDTLINGSEPNLMLIGAIIVVAVLVAGALIVKSRQNKDRADAYAAAASGL